MPRRKTVKENAEENATEQVTEKEEAQEMQILEPMIGIEIENERAQDLVEEGKVLYIDGPELGRRCGKSYMTILNWVNQGRIVPDAYVNDMGTFKPNNGIYLIATANIVIEEVKKKGKPDVKSETEGRKF